MNSMKRQKDRILKEELPRSVGPKTLQEISGEITPETMKGQSQSKNNTQLWMGLVIEAKYEYCKEQHCIGIGNVRSMNQGKLEVKQEMARVNVNISGISKLKWTGMGEFKSDDHYIYYCWQESLKKYCCLQHRTLPPSHPQLGVVFALALSLHSFWSYFSPDLQ